MKPIDIIEEYIDILYRHYTFVSKGLSVEELMKKPKSGNAIGWHLLHVAGGTRYLVNFVMQGKEIEMDKYTSAMTGTDGSYNGEPSIEAIITNYRADLEKMRDFITSKTPEELSKPPKHYKRLPPTMHHMSLQSLFLDFTMHDLMHLGQALEIRRQLNKTVWNE